MTKYFTNFEDIPFIQNGIGGLAFPEARIGNYPSIWTRRGSNVSPGFADAKVFNSSTAIFKRRICSFQNNQQQNVAFSLVAIDTDKGRADVDVVLSVNPQASVSRTQVFVRGQGTTSITDGYIFSIEHAANRVRIYKVQGGVQTNPFPDRSITHSAGTTRIYRFRVSGSNPTTLYVKTWKDEVPEPTTWGLEVTDGGSPENTLTAAGWVGVGVYPTTHGVLGESYINYLGIATGGDTARLPLSNQDFVTWLSLANERRVLFEGSVTGYDGVSAAVSRPVYIANGGYTSHEQDSPSLQNYRPAIAKVPTFRREISLALSGRVTTGIGSLVLNNNAVEALEVPSLSVALLTSVVPESGPLPRFCRPLQAYVKDFEGNFRYANFGEARFEGARRVENLVLKSEDITPLAAVWEYNNASGVDKRSLNVTALPGFHLRGYLANLYSGYSLPTYAMAVVSFEARREGGTGNVAVDVGDTFVNNFTLTDSWRRYSYPTSAVVPQLYGFHFIDFEFSATGRYGLRNVQVEFVTLLSSGFAPSEYVSRGVLKTNSLSDPNYAFSSSSWTKTRSSITAGIPEKLVEDATASNTHFIRQSFGMDPNLSYTLTATVKAAERSVILLTAISLDGTERGAYFNLGTGAVGTLYNSPTEATIQALGDGIYRCRIVVPSRSGGSTPSYTVYVAQSDGVASYNGTGTQGVYVYEAFAVSGNKSFSEAIDVFHGAMVDGVKYFDHANGNTSYIQPGGDNVVTEATGGRLSWLNIPYPCSNGDFASIPHSLAVTITGDIECRAKLAIDWTDSAGGSGARFIISKAVTGTQYSWDWYIDGTGTMVFRVFPDGNVPITAVCTVALSGVTVNHFAFWVRVTKVVSTGNTTFYYSLDEGAHWTQLGAVVTPGAGAAYAGNDPLAVGGQPIAGTSNTPGKIYRAQVYNGIGGTLVADFNPETGAPGWTISGNATIVSAFDQVRLAGYFKERASTNRITRSITFSDAAWAKTSCSVVADNSLAPDGSSDADSLIENALLAVHAISLNCNITANAQLSISVYAKRSGGRNIALVFYNGGNYFRVVFNLLTGVVGSSDVGGSGSLGTSYIEACPNGFYRCVAQGTIAGGFTGGTMEIDLANGTTVASTSYTGDGVSGVRIWGAQVEESYRATSLMVTTTGEVTRPQDLLIYPFSGPALNALGTAFATYRFDDSNGGQPIRVLNDGVSADGNGCFLFVDTTSSGVGAFDVTSVAHGPGGVVGNGSTINGACAWGNSTFTAYASGVRGTEAAYDGSFNMSSIGLGVAGSNEAFQGVIRSVQVFRRKLTNLEVTRLPSSPLGVLLDAAPIPERDDWLRMKWARSYGKMLLGDPSWPRHDFRVVLYGRPSQPTAPNPQQIQMEMKDLLGLLEVPLRTSRYSSSDPLSGQLKPMTYNSPYYMEPVPTNVAGTEHQISDSALTTAPEDVTDDGVSLTTTLTMGAVDTGADTISFRQAGSPTVVVNHGLLTDARVRWASGAPAPLSNGTDYYVVNPTATTIQVAATRGGAATNLTSAGTDGATVTARSWWEDLTNGKITVTASPAGRIMVKKPNATASVLEAGYLYQQIVFPQAISSAIDPTTHFNLSIEHYDQQSFTDLLNAVTQATGIVFYSEDVSALAAIDQVSKGTQTWYGFTPDGLFQVGRISLPSSTSVLDLLESDVKQDSLRLSSVLLPVDRTSLEVRYSKNYYLNGRLNLAPSKIQDLLRDYAAATGTAWSGGTVPLDDHPESAELQDFAPFDTLFSTNGSSEVTRLQTLYKKLLGVFTFQTRISALYRSTGLPICIGDTISLTHSRYGWKSYAAGETSLDATAAFDGTKAVLLGYDVNFSSDDPFPVRMTVFRQIPGYYPTANP